MNLVSDLTMSGCQPPQLLSGGATEAPLDV